MLTITEEATRIRAAAAAGPVGKRKSSFELYELLADCMALANRCKNGPERDEMCGLVAQQPKTGNRRYVEKRSDHFTLVCRYVFHDLRHTNAEGSNASRYAHALRQADLRKIPAISLAKWLGENGGINALYLRRPLLADNVSTRTLYLDRPVTIPKTGTVRLILSRLPDNRCQVHEVAA